MSDAIIDEPDLDDICRAATNGELCDWEDRDVILERVAVDLAFCHLWDSELVKLATRLVDGFATRACCGEDQAAAAKARAALEECLSWAAHRERLDEQEERLREAKWQAELRRQAVAGDGGLVVHDYPDGRRWTEEPEQIDLIGNR